MPNIYVTDETKELLEQLLKAETRTQEGEIAYLAKERAKQLGLLRDDNSFPNGRDSTTPGAKSQGRS